MSIYFLIAIALSAMSAVTEVRVARPSLAMVANEAVRSERRAVRVVRRRYAKRVGQAFLPDRPDKNVWPTLFNVSPRAPSRNC